MKKKNRRGLRIVREKVIEIVRLQESGLGVTAISRSCVVHRQTAREYLAKARAAGVSSQEISELEESDFKRLFQPNKPGRRPKRGEVDYAALSIELSKRGVTLLLLWEEYLRENPNGYGYSHFCQKYMDWKCAAQVSMRQIHKAGEKAFVDYSGMKIPIYEEKNPEQILFESEIFVGVLGASNYTFAEATETQKLKHWIGSQVRMLEYFGGVVEILVPDNLRSGVTKADYYEPGINRTYQDFAEHYDVAIIPTRIKKPKDKSKVENGVQNIQRRILAPLRNRKFFSVAELNIAIGELLEEFNSRVMKSYGKSRRELFLELDSPALKASPKSIVTC